MKIAYPDYQNCGLNLISSILHYFHVENKHETLPYLDNLLKKKQYRNIVLMLFDGMGMDALKQDSPADSFLNTHIDHELSAVFPSTTTAATTSIECGTSPAEHGWLGWTLYFEEIDKAVDIFINKVQNSKESAADYHVASRYMPRGSVFDEINAGGQVKAACVSPFGDPKCDTLEEIGDNVVSMCNEPGQHYVYTYWGDPDHTMHECGVYSDEVKEKISDVNGFVQDLVKRLPEDTLVLATADHGLIDANHLFVLDHPALAEMLVRPPTVEARVAAFHVKEEYLAEFPAAFHAAFPENFIFMTGEEFLKSGLLGDGAKHPKLPSIVGDYVAIATDHDCIDYSREGTLLKGVHAGLTTLEMRVPLILAKK